MRRIVNVRSAKKPPGVPTLDTERFKPNTRTYYFALASYLAATGWVLAEGWAARDWYFGLLALSTVWLPICFYRLQQSHWSVYKSICMIEELKQQMLLLEHNNRPLLLFRSQLSDPDAAGDIRSIGHGTINLRELRN